MEKALLIGERIADDRELVSTIEREEYRVITAKGREDGIALLHSEQPSVVVADHQLQGDDGVQVLKEVREADSACEVILVTEGGEMEVAIEVLRLGALDYLRRPVSLEQLRVSLGRARERRRSRAQVEPSTVLVLEDHEPTRKRVVRILEKEGYRVHAGSDGEEGMQVLAERRIDLILADLRMPRKDGLSVLRDTKRSGADLEVIVTTGYGDEDIVIEALRDGAINFLRKPVDIEQMLLAIQKALEYQSLKRSLSYRNRDIEIMQELVVRLTNRLELIVEAPEQLSPEAVDFLHQLVDSLPFGIVVIDSGRKVVFANHHATKNCAAPPKVVTSDWLEPLGVKRVGDEALEQAVGRTLQAQPGTVETVVVSKWAFLIMTPVKLRRGRSSERYVALAIRGERSKPV